MGLAGAASSRENARALVNGLGAGPVTALQVTTALDDPPRFRRAKNVGAYFGLTPKRWQSGTLIDFQGPISKEGDNDARCSLCEAAHILMMRFKGGPAPATTVWSKTPGLPARRASGYS